MHPWHKFSDLATIYCMFRSAENDEPKAASEGVVGIDRMNLGWWRKSASEEERKRTQSGNAI